MRIENYKKNNSLSLRLSFFFLIVCEVLLITYGRNKLGSLLSPVLLLLISIGIGIFPMLFKKTLTLQNGIEFKTADKTTFYYLLLFFAIGIFTFFIPCGGMHGVMHKFKLEAKYSDVIPTVQVMCRRFVNGEAVYRYIDDFGYHIAPSYLPMVWLPYVIAEMLYIDYRLVTWFIWATVMILLVLAGIRKRNGILNLLGLLLIFLFMFSIIDRQGSALGWTFELANASLYVLLLMGLLSNNLLIKAVVIVCCLLSRYSIVLFLPLIYIVEWDQRGKKSAALLLLYTFILFSAILVPLLHNHWKELYDGYKYYTVSGIGEWNHLDKYGAPVHIANGNGFSAWVYTFKQGSMEEKFAFMQKLHLAFVSITVIVLGIFYWIKRKHLDSRWYIIGGIKIYLAVFYGFIQVPYTYLFLVPVLYSIAMFILLNNNVERIQNRNLINVVPV
ncbi:MAG: hypothetical protein JWN78_2208 [Bacteroidota bacterium]|nr:hypothetical protein [Bacteroidota bacterium]